MTDTACNTLAAHFKGERAKGLVDVKYYVHNVTPGVATKVCDEAAAIFAAIDSGAVEAFEFGDRHPRMA